MTRFAPSARHQDWIERRRSGETLRSIGESCGVTFQGVQKVLARWAPELIGDSPSVSFLPRRRHSGAIIEKCRGLWEGGLSIRGIADRLSADGYPMTHNAVVGLADREGFPNRPSPIKRAS